MSKKIEPVAEANLFDFTFRRNLQYEQNENGNVVLIIPKFKNPFFVKWFVPMLAKKYFRVKLDERGSFIWNNCDGNASLMNIAEKLKQTFNETDESIYRRIATFVLKLERNRFLLRVDENENK